MNRKYFLSMLFGGAAGLVHRWPFPIVEERDLASELDRIHALLLTSVSELTDALGKAYHNEKQKWENANPAFASPEASSATYRHLKDRGYSEKEIKDQFETAFRSHPFDITKNYIDNLCPQWGADEYYACPVHRRVVRDLLSEIRWMASAEA